MIGVLNNLLNGNEFSANNLRRNPSMASNDSKRHLATAITTSSKFFKIKNDYNDLPERPVISTRRQVS